MQCPSSAKHNESERKKQINKNQSLSQVRMGRKMTNLQTWLSQQKEADLQNRYRHASCSVLKRSPLYLLVAQDPSADLDLGCQDFHPTLTTAVPSDPRAREMKRQGGTEFEGLMCLLHQLSSVFVVVAVTYLQPKVSFQ